MDEATTARTSAAHAAFSEATTRKATFVATESQIYRPIPTRGLPETTTTALQNTSGWDDPFSGQRESKPWATAVGAAIGCIAAILLVVLILVLIWEKRRKDSRKENRKLDSVLHPIKEDNSPKSSEEIYENVHAHTNTGFVIELNDIIRRNIQNSSMKSPNCFSKTDNKLPNIQGAKTTTNVVDKRDRIDAIVVEICDDEAYYEDSESIKPVTENLEKSHPKAEENIYINNAPTSDCENGDNNEHGVKGCVIKQDTSSRKNKHSSQIDLEKAQQIYENAAFPVKYNRIATPRICERTHKCSKKEKSPTRKGYQETVQPILQKSERPKRRNPSVLSETELIYDDVPDETAEDYESGKARSICPVKPPIKPKPRLSKIMRNRNNIKTPSPRLKSLDDAVMMDNEVYTGT